LLLKLWELGQCETSTQTGLPSFTSPVSRVGRVTAGLFGRGSGHDALRLVAHVQEPLIDLNHLLCCPVPPVLRFDELASTLELNLFDFSGDLYDHTLEVSIIERIRPIMRFKSAGELVKQMDGDDREVRKVFERIKMPAFPLSRAV